MAGLVFARHVRKRKGKEEKGKEEKRSDRVVAGSSGSHVPEDVSLDFRIVGLES